MDTARLDDIILALLFASDEPLAARKVASILDDVPLQEVKDAIERIRIRVAETFPIVVLERVAGGYQLSTHGEYAEYVARLYHGRRKQRLSKAAMETLAIIAYKQPITRADIESIRGVGCGAVITTLMERSLIRIVGKARVLGAPFLYGTTQELLEYLGLDSLKDLPSMEELEALLEKEEAGAAEGPAPEGVEETAPGGEDREPEESAGASGVAANREAPGPDEERDLGTEVSLDEKEL